jgi:uncharacterized membrane protein
MFEMKNEGEETATKKKNEDFLKGGLLGLVIYGVYDTTTLALLRGWDTNLAIIDILWGTTLFSLTTFLTLKICN